MREYACLDSQSLTFENYSIAPVQDDDIEPIRLWRNRQMDVLRQAKEIEVDEQRRYYMEKIWPDMDLSRPQNILMTLYLNRSPIGYGGLVHIGWEHKRAEVSFLVAPERTQDDVMYENDFTAFLSIMKMLGFGKLSLNRLYTETYDIRHHHISILEKNSFGMEGILREHVVIDARPVNSILQGCLKSDEK